MRRPTILATILMIAFILSGCREAEIVMPPLGDYVSHDYGTSIETNPSLEPTPGKTNELTPTPIATDESTNSLPSTDLSTDETQEPGASSDSEETTGIQSPSTDEPTPKPMPTDTPPLLDYSEYDASVIGFSYPPSDQVIDTLSKYNAHAYGPRDEKKIYLSFNAGYEYDNGMQKILDILGFYDIKATFFVDGAFIRTQPDLTRRIVNEGHLLGNHTIGHADMPGLAASGQYDEAQRQITAFEDLVFEVTGHTLAKVYRPPSSDWSERSLEIVRRMGYTTYLFSYTHRDWEVDNQPNPDTVLESLKQQVFPGSLIMLHTVSQTNVRILEDYIKYVYNMGYDFGVLPLGP